MQSRVRSPVWLLAFSLLLAACGGEEDDGGPPEPPPEPNPWAGKTYLLSINPDFWIEPGDIGEDIGEFVPQFLLAVGDGNDPKVTIATALNGAQDQCNATTEVTGSANNPESSARAEDFLLHVVHPRIDVTVDLNVHDLTFTNLLPNAELDPDGDLEGELTVEMDVNEAYVLFDLVPDSSRTPEGVCTILEMAGSPCTTCSFGAGEARCLVLKAVQLEAEETSIAVEPIAAADRDPSCTP